jgi:hypothetical protein
MNRRVAIPVGMFAALAGAMLWYVYGERRVPEGQPPLATLSASTLETFRADFNRDADRTRIILLLSPT